MSLAKIKKTMGVVRDNYDEITWYGEELVDLILAIAEHVIVLGSESLECEEVPEGYVRIKDFVKEYKFFSPDTLYKHCKHYPEFAEKCAFRSGSKWFVDPIKTFEYLRNLPSFKKRLERLSNS